MRRIVITGGTGLLGSYLLPLLRDEAELHVLGPRAPNGAGVIHHRIDLAAGIDSTSLPPSADSVIHLAQSRRFRDFPEAAAEVARVNALAAVELAQYAARAGANRFIYVSTGGVYAAGPDPLTESAPLAGHPDLSFYAATKLAAERLLEPFGTLLSLIVLRPFFIYGRGQDRSMLIPRLADCVASGAPIRLAGDDGIRLNPIHASDAAAAVRAALGLQASDTVNLAGPEVLTLRSMAEEIARRLGTMPVFEAEAVAEPRDLVGDTGRMARLLHLPRERFVDHVAELLE